MKFLRNKFHEKIIAANRGKLTNKMSVTRLRHKNSLKMQRLVFQMEVGVWEISAATNKSKCYKIIEEKTSACCLTNCPDCHLCIHQFKCSCPDNSIRFNMCKHIHYVKWKIGDVLFNFFYYLVINVIIIADRQEVHSRLTSLTTRQKQGKEALLPENGM